MNRYHLGLVVGKFAPLHLGHEQVIRAAINACDHVVILSYSRPEFRGCEPLLREKWLAARFPNTTRIVIDHKLYPLPDNSDSDDIHRSFCAEILHRHVDQPIDAIFSSETYGPGFADSLSLRQASPVKHVFVDFDRNTFPISGTRLRADIHGLRHYLAPEVYASFIERIAILGGESTGKSTLAAALAKELNTSYVAEYGRELWDQRHGKLRYEDMLSIAQKQVAHEEAALLSPATQRFLFCDTSPLTTLFYSMEMFGHADPMLELLAHRQYDHLILCKNDFPFCQDGTRRDKDFQIKGQEWYRQKLCGMKYKIVQGNLSSRISQTVGFVNAKTTP